MWTQNSQMFKLDLEKTGTVGSWKKQENSRKTSTAYWICQSLCVDNNKMWKIILKRWEYQTTLPASWEICMQVRKQQLELDMEQQTGSK